MQQAVEWLTSSDRQLRFQAFGEELELADRVLQLVQGYGFRAILDSPLAVIQLKPNDGLNGRRDLRFRHQRSPPGRSHEGLQAKCPRSQSCRDEGDGQVNSGASQGRSGREPEDGAEVTARCREYEGVPDRIVEAQS